MEYRGEFGLIFEVAEGAAEVDVFAIVREMRLERCQMVQTEQQYICIHHCLLALLQVTTPLPVHSS